jgi:glycosyltransferase involved in cell wall biosynthesis
MMFASEYTGVPIITDLDDDVLSVRDDQPAASKGYKKGQLQRTVVGTMLSFSKALFCTNDYLGKKITSEIKNIFNVDLPYFVLPNYNNKDDWNFKSPKNKKKVVIGWHGSLTHDSDLIMVLPYIRKIMRERPNVYLELMGGVNKEFALRAFKDWGKLKDRVKLIAGTQAWHNFPYHLMKQKWDIGIAPLIDDEFNRSKSNIKWMEYAMKKIPTIASDVEPYRGVKNIILTRDWYQDLTNLIENPKLRTQLGEGAYNEVCEEWQYKGKGQKWIDAFNSVLKSNTKD